MVLRLIVWSHWTGLSNVDIIDSGTGGGIASAMGTILEDNEEDEIEALESSKGGSIGDWRPAI
jgi:hypothetical protein